jgi:hypothetical protein
MIGRKSKKEVWQGNIYHNGSRLCDLQAAFEKPHTLGGV